jgi:uncharacterized protein (DUF2126 family)
VCGAQCAQQQRELQQVEGELIELTKTVFKPGDKVECKMHGKWSSGWTIDCQVAHDIYAIKHEYHRTDQEPIWQDPKYIRHDQRLNRVDQGKARTLSELLALAKERGYSPGWAYRIHQARGQR